MATPRVIALLSCLDPGASPDYTRGGVRPELWESGWPGFYDLMGIANLWTTLGISRFMLYAPFGVYATADTKTIGSSKSQAAVTSVVLGPRQAEDDLQDDRLVAGLPSAGLPGFNTFWQGNVAGFVGQGGEVICYQSAPPSSTSTAAITLDGWTQEAETCGMSVALDGCGDTDRLSYGTPVGVLSDRLALRRRRTYIGQHALLDPRTNGWYDGRFAAVSTKTRADLVWATPANYGVPNLGQESLVLLRTADVSSAATRLQTALAWLGRTTRGSPWTVAVETYGMTDAQITTLVQAGGG